MTKTYKAASYYTSARPRSKQLRECGSTTSNANSSSARNNTTTIYNTTEGHTHDNKDDLDKISIDTNRYIYVTQTEELADGTSSTTNEKAKAGYADEAGTAAEASHAATADKATTAEIANDLADNAPILDTVLRSNQEDTAQEIITFLKGLKLGEDGLYYIDGEGIAQLQKLIVETISSTNINNAENISTKDLSVTGTAHFFQLIIDKLNSVEGAIIATNAHAKINRILWLSSGSVIEGGDTDNVLSSTNYAYHDANPSDWDTCRLLWKSTDDNGENVTNTFAANDGIVCWDTKGLNAGASFGATNKFYWCKVYATGTTSYYDANGDNTNYNYIDILATDVATNGDYYDGAFRPAVFDNTSQLGFFGSDSDTLSLRGNALILSAYATPDQGGLIDGTQYDPIKPPSFVQYKEIKTCSLAPYRMNVQAANGNIFKGAFVAIAASGDEYEITKGTAAMTLHAFKNFADSETASIPTNATYNFATQVFYPGDNGWSADVPAAADGYTTYVTLAVVSGSESNDCAIDVTSWVTPYPNSGARGEKGEKGEKGDNGDDGDTPTIGSDGYWYINGVSTGIKAEASNGTSNYIHVAYADSTTGTNFSTTYYSGALYIGTCVTEDETDPTTYSSYDWNRIKGEDGASVVFSPAVVCVQTTYSGTNIDSAWYTYVDAFLYVNGQLVTVSNAVLNTETGDCIYLEEYAYEGASFVVGYNNNSEDNDSWQIFNDYVIDKPISITLTGTLNGEEYTATGTFTVVKVKGGQNSKTLSLSNDTDIMQYDSAGNLITTDGVSTTATMYDGATAVDASSVTWTYEVTSGTATVTQSTNTFTVTSLSTDTAEITISATQGSDTLTKIFSVKKLVGTDKYELVLSDNAVRCSTDGTANPSSITIQVYHTDSNGTREDISSTLISGNGTNTYGLQVLLRQYMNDSYYNTYGQWNDTSYYEAMTFPCTDIYQRYVALLQSSDGTLTYDVETIPVVSDGEGTAGKSYNASLNSLVVKCTINSSNNYIIASDAADSKIYLTCSDSTVTASSVVVTSGSATSGTTLTTSSQYLNNIGYSFSTSNQYIALAMNTNGTLTAHSDKIVVTWSDGVTSTHSLQIVPLVDGSIEDVETTTVYRLNPLTETALIKLSGGGTSSLSQTLNVSLSYSILKVSGETESVLSSLPSGYAISGAYNNGTTISFSSLSYALSGGSYSTSDGRNTIVVTLKNSNSVVVDARTIPIVFEQTSALSVTSAGITAISQNATDISTIEQTASSLQSTVSTLSGQMSTIEQKADSIALKVSNGTLDSKRWNLIDNAYLNTAFFNNIDSSRTMVLQAGHTYTMTVCGKALTNNTILRVYTYTLLSNTYWVGCYYIDISSTASTTASVTFTVPTSFSSSETSATLTYSEGDSVTYYLSPYIYNSSGSTSLGSSYKAFIEWVVIEEGSTSSGQYLLSETDPYVSANMLSGIQSCTSGDIGTSYIQNNGASVSTSTVTLGDIDFYYWYKTGVASTVMLQAENLYDMERYGVYTLSFWAKGSSSSAYLRVIFPSGTSASGIMSVVSSQGYAYCSQGYVNVTLTTSWVRYWVTFFHNGAYSGAGFSLLTMNTYTYYVAGLKLCKGGRIDDWTDYGVSAMSEDGANIYSYIQQTESKISLRVASLESTSELLVKDNKIIAKTNTFEVQDSSGNTTFAIDDNGNLNSSGDAAFSGKVTASSGSIGDFNISDGSLTNSDTTAYLQFDNSYYNIKIGGDKAVGMQISDNGTYDSFLGAYFKADVGLHSNYHFIADGEMQCLHQTPTTGSTITLSNKYNGSVITGTGTLTINAAYSDYLNVEMFAASSCTLAFQHSDSYTYFKHGSTTAASLSLSVSAYQIIRIFSSGSYIYIALISTS